MHFKMKPNILLKLTLRQSNQINPMWFIDIILWIIVLFLLLLEN